MMPSQPDLETRTRWSSLHSAHRELDRTSHSINMAADELVCPITQSLPIDPVTAEDGKVYERSAIAKWLESHHRSPLTNEPMGPRLLPAHQVKNLLRTMATSGMLAGGKVDAWREKLRNEELEQKAADGDAEAMHRLGVLCLVGAKGCPQDEVRAFGLFERSHEAGDARGTTALGSCYVYGRGTFKDQTLGIMLYTQAGLAGSQHACYLTARAFENGLYGLPIDDQRAREWYARIMTCSIVDLNEFGKENAAAWLRKNAAQTMLRNLQAPSMQAPNSPDDILARHEHQSSRSVQSLP